TDLVAWLEQLLAESTGKEGKGLIPVDREPLGPPEVYGADRLFVYLRLASAPDEHQDSVVQALEGAGHPVVRITVDDLYDLGAEFFRWEFATAVAGSVLGVNPFNQPDVEASKVATRRLTDEYEKTGKLPPESPLRVSDRTLAAALGAHFRTIKPGDYVALLAYLEMTAAHEATLQAIRRAVRDRYRVATCVGFGPRFLHSTGQAYKGGPNTGVFLQVTCDDAAAPAGRPRGRRVRGRRERRPPARGRGRGRGADARRLRGQAQGAARGVGDGAGGSPDRAGRDGPRPASGSR